MSGGLGNKVGAAGGGAEVAETPILCETCLGPNPYVRMSKQAYGKECKICDRPFTVFRWNPGSGMRFKKTEICTTCAKIKNVCQTCVLDLQYGLPVQVRDTALGLKSQAPSTDINKQYFINHMEEKLDGNATLVDSSAGPSSRAGQELLKRLAKERHDPSGVNQYKRNRPHLCSFYAKGECTRGDACPFRHELPVDNELSRQNIKDRFHGRNDPVAKKLLGETARSKGLEPPEDKEVMSLFLTGLEPTVEEGEIRTYFVTNVPSLTSEQIKSITVVPASRCAFINFRTRMAAELAAQRCAVSVELGGSEVKVQWGRSRPNKAKAKGATSSSTSTPSTTGQDKSSEYGVAT